MLQVHDGQCGMCVHFGENNQQDEPKLIQIRTTHQAPDDLVEPCGLPGHAQYNLMVTPDSGCAAFAHAVETQANVDKHNAD